MTKRRRALLSVYDKKGLKELAETLVSSGYELVSSGGTASHLKECGLPVTPVEMVSGNPQAFGGRMKTISFEVESAILFDRSDERQREEAERLGIIPIDVVVCNFYPFEKVFQEKLQLPEAVELIDIGGPAMARSAAKNFQHVLLLVDPEDYPEIQSYLITKKEVPLAERLRLAAKAFSSTALYDSMIDRYFHERVDEEILWLRFQGGEKLRYGENPHQTGSVFWSSDSDPLSLSRFIKIFGKELSFNNYLDVQAAVDVLASLGGERPACVIVKHTNPCGAAVRGTLDMAFEKAWEGDPLAAFGGVVAMNRPFTMRIVQKFLDEKRFVEIVMSPEAEPAALRRLAEKKKNLIVLVNPSLSSPALSKEDDFKRIRGGILVQEPDTFSPKEEDLEMVSERRPNPDEMQDLLFAWKIGKESKSNSVVLAKEEQLIGSGVGQQDRLRACKLAVEKAGLRSIGSCAASDAFFPFSDGPEALIKAGVTAIIHPGGSIRDSETVALCNEHRVALVTTKGKRAFKH